MKKKIRKIVVDNREYAWQVNTHISDSEIYYRRLKIWRDKNTVIYDQKIPEGVAITPSCVEKQIKKN